MTPASSNEKRFDPSPDERERMVAVAAYYLAEHRGFAPGGQDDDWRRAERQIDSMLATMRRCGVDGETLRRTGLRNALRMWARDG
ncbi:MAG: DUF2934 domain-containing protein [Thiohalocapsa sp.]|nr:DUF2934 domain-containing protein [Thiohalocapsa sp.]